MTQNTLMDLSGYVAPDSASARLYNRMKTRLQNGEHEQKKLIESVAKMVIRDKLVAPAATKFSVAPDGKLRINYLESPAGPTAEQCTLHRHALMQLASKVNVPLTYVHHLQNSSEASWKAHLLAHILSTSYTFTEFPDRSGQARFLHRIVNGELRGFLSRRFNRHIASAPLLRAFLGATQEADAFPFAAVATDVKLALKCYLPHIFEPVPGEFVCLGVEWANSDFGAGRMQVALTMWMPQGDRFTVLDHTLSRVHIGSVIEDSDIELSDETARKEAEAQSSAIRDSVRSQLSIENVEKVLKAIERAHSEEVSWTKLKGSLSKFLGKKEIDVLHSILQQESIVLDLPPVAVNDDGPTPTKWWASSALSWLANKQEDPDRKIELEHAAGSFLEVK